MTDEKPPEGTPPQHGLTPAFSALAGAIIGAAATLAGAVATPFIALSIAPIEVSMNTVHGPSKYFEVDSPISYPRDVTVNVNATGWVVFQAAENNVASIRFYKRTSAPGAEDASQYTDEPIVDKCTRAEIRNHGESTVGIPRAIHGACILELEKNEVFWIVAKIHQCSSDNEDCDDNNPQFERIITGDVKLEWRAVSVN